MKIAFVSLMDGLPWGGSEALWSATAKHAILQGEKVFVSVYEWTTLPKKVAELKSLGCLIHKRQRFNSINNFLSKTIYSVKNKIIGVERFYKPVLDFGPDIVVVNQGGTWDLAIHHKAFYEKLMSAQVPFILISHAHNQFSDIPTNVIFPNAREIVKNAAISYYVSERMKSYAERQLCSTLDNARLTWNPLNLNGAGSAIKWPTSSTMNFAVVGALTGTKGCDMIIAALSNIRWNDRNWQLNIYGDGDGKEYLQQLTNHYNLDNKVVFHGHVSDMNKVWEQNHMLLIGSAGEGMPISLIEAMACGRPAMVTDVGGNTEMIRDGINGFVSESPYVTYIDRALDRAWQQKENWEILGFNARETVLKKVDLQPEVSLYKAIINNA